MNQKDDQDNASEESKDLQLDCNSPSPAEARFSAAAFARNKDSNPTTEPENGTYKSAKLLAERLGLQVTSAARLSAERHMNLEQRTGQFDLQCEQRKTLYRRKSYQA